MIRLYEDQGWVRPSRPADHRRYDESDVRRIRRLRALLAAGVAPDLAARALDGRLRAAEHDEVRRALDLLLDEVGETLTALDGRAPGGDGDLPEQRISLMFDAFMVRTRMESVLSSALSPVGILSADYGIISLIWTEGAMTSSTLARLVGVAPSTLGGRIAGLVRRGWVRRRPDPDDRRSWRLELTPDGDRLIAAAIPHARDCATRIDLALHTCGAHPDAIRASLLTLSTALRSLLPD